MKYCVYLTIYRGNKLPPFYIGSSSLELVERGYRGSVKSKEYEKTWRRETLENPHLFETKIIKVTRTRQEALSYEHRVQSALGVTTNPLYTNKSLARDFKSLRRGVKLTQEQRKKISQGQRGHKSSQKQVETVRKMSAKEWVVTHPDGNETEVFNLSAFARERGGLNVSNMITSSSKGYRARLKNPGDHGWSKGSKKSDEWRRRISERTKARWLERKKDTVRLSFEEFLSTIIIPDDVSLVLEEASLERNVARREWDDERERGRSQYRVTRHEWVHKTRIVASMIMAKLGVSPVKLHARKLRVEEIPPEEGREFHARHHVAGSGSSSVAMALVDRDGRRVAVMSFARSRYDGYQWELNRFSTVYDTTVVGGAGKLFSEFVRRYDPESVVSFADLRWGRGRVYEMIGFELIKMGPPTYWYFHPDLPDRLSRMTFMKGKLEKKLERFDPDKTELENMRDNGYSQYWDCGSAEYRWTRS